MIQFYYDGVNVGKILAKNYLFKRDDMTDHEHGFKVEHMEFPEDFEFLLAELVTRATERAMEIGRAHV